MKRAVQSVLQPAASLVDVIPPVLAQAPSLSVAKPHTGADYQTSIALQAAKAAKVPPLSIAEQLVAAVQPSAAVSAVTASPPGFVNVSLSPRYLADGVEAAAETGFPSHSRLADRRVLLDFGSPNMGKALHVGHLRSAVVGDTMARLFEYGGAEVERVSHVGDMGLPVAVVMAEMEARGVSSSPSPSALSDMYIGGKQRMAADPAFHDRVSGLLRELQLGSAAPAATRKLWTTVCDASRAGYQPLLRSLQVSVTDRGESTYVDGVPGLVKRLVDDGVAQDKDGAVVVRYGDGEDDDIVIQKSDGGYLYVTTDLECLRRRTHAGFTDVVYVVDVAQSLHFKALFAIGERLGWMGPGVDGAPAVSHAAFGLVQGEGGRKLSSRSGETMTLEGLLAEGLAAARASVEDKQQSRSKIDPSDTATLEALAAGAIRYYDLSHARTKNYPFSFQHALSFKGNTSVSLLYAVARVQALLERTGGDTAATRIDVWEDLMADPLARALAFSVLQLPDVVDDATEGLAPHILCDHLAKIAQRFHAFYGGHRVIDPDTHAVSHERLRLCVATQAALKTGLDLLGIPVIERL